MVLIYASHLNANSCLALKTLLSVIINDKSEIVKIFAYAKMGDKDKLHEIYMRNKDIHIKNTAIRNIQDFEILSEIAENADVFFYSKIS